MSKFFNQSRQVKISIIACIVVLIILISSYKRINKMLSDFEYSITSCIIYGTVKTGALVIILLLLINASKWIDDLVYLTSWLIACRAVVYFIFDPIYIKHHKGYVKEKEEDKLINAIRKANEVK